MANNVDYQDLINTYQKLLAEYNEAGKRYNTIGNVDYACAVLLLVAAAMCIKHDNYCFASIDLFIAALNTVIGKISKNCAKKIIHQHNANKKNNFRFTNIAKTTNKIRKAPHGAFLKSSYDLQSVAEHIHLHCYTVANFPWLNPA